MRESLHTHWTAIAAHLQKFHRFSEDAITWEKSLAEEDPNSGSLSWMEELASDSDEICLDGKDLVRESDKIIDHLASLTPQLCELLRGPSKLPASPATTAFLGNIPSRWTCSCCVHERGT
ncbi:hypothetical protein MVEN_02471900 [Mycena venus]|uniref:Uncharacterized protein n=1 Tax=Mycena venus TaxID=2733690 RepID=A0A8H6WX88_9AGAR|nr:hypothetical protein MVEN_02471900 [Mycena venus]